MSIFEGNFTSSWPPSPSPRAILAMLNQPEDDVLNTITEIFPQTNLLRNHHSEQRSGLRERLAKNSGFNVATLDTENRSPPAAFSWNATVPSPVFAISPGFSLSSLLQSPNILLQSPNMVTDFLPENLPPASATDYGPPKMVETSGEGNETTMILNNDLPYQPTNLNQSHEEGFDDIPTEESIYIPSYENHVEPIGAPLVVSVESDQLVDNADANIISIEDSEYEDENQDGEDDGNEDQDNNDDSDEAEPSPPKRRKLEVSKTMGATRSSSTERIIIVMKCDEDNPEDGYRWRKYGRKNVKRNPNPRNYYKCTEKDCKVKKHVERGADDVKLLVIGYDGRHNHPVPAERGRHIFGSKNQSETINPQNHINQTSGLNGPLPPSSTTPLQMRPPQIDLAQLYMSGLAKFPNLPVYHNPVYQNDEPMMNVVPDGSGVYNLFSNF